MWAYVAAYKSPHDDPDAQARRMHVDYPIVADRVLGLGELPTLRLQRALARRGPDGAEWRALDRVLVWAHWTWFMVPHGSLVYILVRHPQRFPRAAVMTYAVFDIGASVYWLAPTAPPLVRGLGCRARRRRPQIGSAIVEGRGRAGGAADDGRVRGVLLARRLGAALQCVRRQSPGCDALAALRHIRDGRAPARRGGTGRGRARLLLRGDARIRACVPRASTTWWTCSPGRR